MTTTDLAVLAATFAAIVWVNWYFFRAGRPVGRAETRAGGVQEQTIEVRGGYSPSVIRARSGSRLRLVFDRQETSGCSEEVVIPDFGIRRFLPAFEKTVIELEPGKPGTYEFTCGMSMLRGKLIVEDSAKEQVSHVG